jgi:hypothetical protein
MCLVKIILFKLMLYIYILMVFNLNIVDLTTAITSLNK